MTRFIREHKFHLIYLQSLIILQIEWTPLSGNPNAIAILKQNLRDIDWENLSGNPAIFTNPWKSVIKPAVKVLGSQKRAVERVNHPERLSQQGYFNFHDIFS